MFITLLDSQDHTGLYIIRLCSMLNFLFYLQTCCFIYNDIEQRIVVTQGHWMHCHATANT